MRRSCDMPIHPSYHSLNRRIERDAGYLALRKLAPRQPKTQLPEEARISKSTKTLLQRLNSLKIFDILSRQALTMDLLIITDHSGVECNVKLLSEADALCGLPSFLEVRLVLNTSVGYVPAIGMCVSLSPEPPCRSLSCSKLSISRSRKDCSQ